MANIKSSKKRILVLRKKTALNKAQKTKMKTYIRQFLEAVDSGDQEVAKDKFKNAERVIRKTASKGVIHKNNADRKISRLYKKLSSMAQ